MNSQSPLQKQYEIMTISDSDKKPIDSEKKKQNIQIFGIFSTETE